MLKRTKGSRLHAQMLIVGALLGTAATPALAAAAAAAAGSANGTAQSEPGPNDPNREIVVVGSRLFPGVRPERDLDPQAIESYGADSIEELVGDVEVELGDESDEPLIIVNGERIYDLDEIGGYPPEVLRNLQVLPRGSAVRLGGKSGQRVISLTLNRMSRSATLSAAHKLSTEGQWNADRADATLTNIVGNTRANLALHVRDENRLLESDRGIIQPLPRIAYASIGNLLGYPDTSGEIDPLLSNAAGQTVTVAQLPAVADPTLADFVRNANQGAVTDLGPFRTLRPSGRYYDLNADVSTRLTPWLRATGTLRLSRSTDESLRGLAGALFILSPNNPASPFSRDVGLAFYAPEPLQSRSRRTSGEANLTLNARLGQWTGNFNARHSDSRSLLLSQRQRDFDPIQLGADINPFSASPAGLIQIVTDRVTSRAIGNLAQLSFTGPALQLPAGPLIATVEGRLHSSHLRSSSTFSDTSDRNIHMSDTAVRGALDVPLTSRDKGFGAALGDLSATGEYSRVRFSRVGSLTAYSSGITWEPISALRVRGSIESSEAPPAIEILGDPIVITHDVRVFDPLTGDTVDVTLISGGNPDLKPQKTKIERATALLRLVPRLNLELNAEYTDTDRRNFVSGLPTASAAIMLGFPDRYIRDANGVLTTVDLRPVNFLSDHEKRLRWGFNMNTKLFGPASESGPRAIGSRAPAPSTYLELTANHTIVFSEDIVIRNGVDPVDLLNGGAVGIGGGRLRHQVDGTAAVTSGGLGVRTGFTWRGRSELLSQIDGKTDTLRFSPVLLINVRAFADLQRVLPRSTWAKSLRLSLDVVNALNRRQTVRDSLGNTPLQYQPAYRDPLGRTVEIELRKVF